MNNASAATRLVAPQALPQDPVLTAALATARRVIDENPRASLKQLCALSWLAGRAHLAEEIAPSIREARGMLESPAAPAANTVYDNSATCQGCGTKELLASSVPATSEQLNGHICRRCLEGDSL